jgi:hypothetical protein
MSLTHEYIIIAATYGDKTAKRSNVPLINHINEGIIILDEIGASDTAKRAYCMHPVLQDDDSLLKNYEEVPNLSKPSVLIATMEYRRVANNYLSKRTIDSIDEIELSPLKDVNDMLIADKVQNRKDFELYHLDTHERSNVLDQYFKNWLTRLGITEERYQELVKLIS